MAMTMLMILVLIFAFVNMPIMLAISITYQTKRYKYATNRGNFCMDSFEERMRGSCICLYSVTTRQYRFFPARKINSPSALSRSAPMRAATSLTAANSPLETDTKAPPC